MKRALVTGAAGFIGSHVVQQLLHENVQVRAMLRPGEPTDNLEDIKKDIEIVEADVLDPKALERVLTGVDTLFHMAAIYSFWMEDWSKIYQINIQGSRNVLWSALKKGVGRVVYTSTAAALGIAPGNSSSTEDTPFDQFTVKNHYVLTKYLSQQEALGFAQNGLDLVVVNPTMPFGERDSGPTPTGQVIVDILTGANRFYFNGGFNIVDVKDVARGHVLAAQKGRRGELYILGNRNVSLKEFNRLVCQEAGLKHRVFVKLPVSVTKFAATGMTWWADKVSHRKPLASPGEIQISSQYYYFDNTKAQKELGLSFTPVEESLRAAIQWFRSTDRA